jgi:hypothetical protein
METNSIIILQGKNYEIFLFGVHVYVLDVTIDSEESSNNLNQKKVSWKFGVHKFLVLLRILLAVFV